MEKDPVAKFCSNEKLKIDICPVDECAIVKNNDQEKVDREETTRTAFQAGNSEDKIDAEILKPAFSSMREQPE